MRVMEEDSGITLIMYGDRLYSPLSFVGMYMCQGYNEDECCDEWKICMKNDEVIYTAPSMQLCKDEMSKITRKLEAESINVIDIDDEY